jgi:hypothetical protein
LKNDELWKSLRSVKKMSNEDNVLEFDKY